MHIVQILPELNQGGVETMVLTLNRELAKRGLESTVISQGGLLAGQVEADGGRHLQLKVGSKNPLTLVSRIRKLRAAIAALEPDILHAHSRVPAWLGWFANRRSKRPWVTTVHGFNRISRYSRIMTWGDAVICVSHPVKDYILKHYPVDGGRVRVIHCGVDMERFHPARVDPQEVEALKKAFDLEGRLVVASVGRITELKDHETFIRAVGLARAERPDILGLVVGHVRHDKVALFGRLQELVRELNLTGHIRFATDCRSMPALYGLSALVVSCSMQPESFGLTLVESLAMTTPVAATRHGGPLDIIEEGVNGRFFAKGNPRELARILVDPMERRDTLRESVLHRFSVEKMIDSTLSVYQALARHD